MQSQDPNHTRVASDHIPDRAEVASVGADLGAVIDERNRIDLAAGKTVAVVGWDYQNQFAQIIDNFLLGVGRLDGVNDRVLTLQMGHQIGCIVGAHDRKLHRFTGFSDSGV